MNDFHKAGGMQVLMRELIGAGLLHEDVRTVWGTGLSGYLQTPELYADGGIAWHESAGKRQRQDHLHRRQAVLA